MGTLIDVIYTHHDVVEGTLECEGTPWTNDILT